MGNSDLSQAMRSLHQEIDRSLGRGLAKTSPSACGRPRVGITAHHTDLGSCLALAYSDAVARAGGIPLLIPITDDLGVLLDSLRSVDALLLSGGADLNPLYMDEEPVRGLGRVSPERDAYELRLIRLAHRLSMPMLGICRGHQILGVSYGSTLFQDVVSQYTVEGAIDHEPSMPKTIPHHRVGITDRRCRLVDILDVEEGEEVWVNSLHHQALREVHLPFVEVAIASDGINEAIDAFPELDILAVQWHPEQLVAGGDARQLRLFEHLVERARLYRRARAFHTAHITLDSHTDTPMFFAPDYDLGSSPKTRVDITKMELGQIDASVMVAYLPQGELTDEAHREALTLAEDKLRELHRQVEAYPHRATIARTADEVAMAKARGLRAILPAIENGYAIGRDLSHIQALHEQYGIIYITLCHNGDNALCDSARRSERTHGGLSTLGREAVAEMNRLGIVIDLSHAGEETVRDVLELSSQPVVASHSSARSLCDHARNLSDDQIRAIARRGGVVQVCLYAGFINSDEGAASYLDAVDHIEHIIRVAGIDHVGIGSDLDGDGELIGLRTSQDLIRITIELLRRGYDEDDLRAIWGGNFLRVLHYCQSHATARP